MPDPEQTSGKRNPGKIFLALAAAAVIAGTWRAWSFWFVNDDAFISFRYARHLAEGMGLVYNPGELVEGFTNFLWTVLVAGAMKLGADPVAFSVTAGICAFAVMLGLWAYVSWKLDAQGALVGIPLTALVLAFHRDMNVYATSGLETSLVTLLVSTLFVLLLFGRTARSLLLAGAVASLAMMTRPDAILFLAAGAVFLAVGRPGRVKALTLFLLPVAAGFVPYWLWRWSYYGFFFPNAYYAKSIALPYYGQGLQYAWLYCSTYYVLVLIPVLAVLLMVLRRRRGAVARVPLTPETLWGHAMLLAALFTVVAALFIIRIGGDFMFARFFVSVTPMAFLMLELLIARLPWPKVAVAVALVVVLLTFLRNDRFRQESSIGYIADEWQWYPSSTLGQTERNGALLHRFFQGLPVRVAYWAGQAKLIYYADPYVAVEASAGLTDTALAHRTIKERGRPGHEKSAPLDYLASKGVHFFFYPLTPPPGPLPANLILFDSIPARIVTYDDALMKQMALRHGAQFVRFPEFLDRYIGDIASQPREQVESDYRFFRSFYFDRNADSTRQQKILAYLQKGAHDEPN